MTRATTTRKNKAGEPVARPTIRKVVTGDGEMTAEIHDRYLALRPLRSRAGGPSEVTVTWGSIYLRAMLARVEERRRARRKKGRRR